MSITRKPFLTNMPSKAMVSDGALDKLAARYKNTGIKKSAHDLWKISKDQDGSIVLVRAHEEGSTADSPITNGDRPIARQASIGIQGRHVVVGKDVWHVTAGNVLESPERTDASASAAVDVLSIYTPARLAKQASALGIDDVVSAVNALTAPVDRREAQDFMRNVKDKLKMMKYDDNTDEQVLDYVTSAGLTGKYTPFVDNMMLNELKHRPELLRTLPQANKLSILKGVLDRDPGKISDLQRIMQWGKHDSGQSKGTTGLERARDSVGDWVTDLGKKIKPSVDKARETVGPAVEDLGQKIKNPTKPPTSPAKPTPPSPAHVAPPAVTKPPDPKVQATPPSKPASAAPPPPPHVPSALPAVSISKALDDLKKDPSLLKQDKPKATEPKKDTKPSGTTSVTDKPPSTPAVDAKPPAEAASPAADALKAKMAPFYADWAPEKKVLVDRAIKDLKSGTIDTQEATRIVDQVMEHSRNTKEKKTDEAVSFRDSLSQDDRHQYDVLSKKNNNKIPLSGEEIRKLLRFMKQQKAWDEKKTGSVTMKQAIDDTVAPGTEPASPVEPEKAPKTLDQGEVSVPPEIKNDYLMSEFYKNKNLPLMFIVPDGSVWKLEYNNGSPKLTTFKSTLIPTDESQKTMGEANDLLRSSQAFLIGTWNPAAIKTTAFKRVIAILAKQSQVAV